MKALSRANNQAESGYTYIGATSGLYIVQLAKGVRVIRNFKTESEFIEYVGDKYGETK